MEKVTARKLIGWGEDVLIAKATNTNKAKQGTNSLLPMAGRCSAVSRRAGLHQVEWILGKTNVTTPSVPLSSFFPPFYILAMMSYGLEYPSDQFGPPVPAMPPYNVPCSSSFLANVAGWTTEKALGLCKLCSEITNNSILLILCSGESQNRA